MKKVMKALALALALCMVLSVSAFAVSSTDKATIANKTTHTVAFEVSGLASGEQVALLVLEPGTAVADADEDTILYIDQQQASSEGVAAFSAAIADGTAVVDVWVGSQTVNSEKSGAWNVYENVEVAETSSIKLAQGDATMVIAPGEGGTGTVQYGVAIKMTLNKISVEKMIWAFGDNNKTVYSKPIILNYTDMQSIEGDTWFTAAVAPSIVAAAGEEAGENQLSALTTVNAIFRCNNQNYFTNADDKANGPASEVVE